MNPTKSASKVEQSTPRFETEGRRLLSEWLNEKSGPGPTRIAEAMDVTRAAVAGFAAGEYRPKSDARDRLAVFSGGRIPADSWLLAEEREALGTLQPFVANDTANDPVDPPAHTDSQPGT